MALSQNYECNTRTITNLVGCNLKVSNSCFGQAYTTLKKG